MNREYIIGMANSFFGLGSLILSTFSEASLEYHGITKEFINGNNHTKLINVLTERAKLDPEGLEAKMQYIHEESLAIHEFELVAVAMLGLLINLIQEHILGVTDSNLPRVISILGIIVPSCKGFFDNNKAHKCILKIYHRNDSNKKSITKISRIHHRDSS